MFKTRLYWFTKDNGDFAEREFTGEGAARAHAEARSKMVAGGVYVLRKDSAMAWYENGIDTTASVG